MRATVLPIALALASPGAAMAAPPPDNAMKISEIATAVEAEAGENLHYIESIEWDDDGYWDVEYKRRDGSEVEVKIDPLTGSSRS